MYDVTVIGGGPAGCAAALRAAAAGRRVALVADGGPGGTRLRPVAAPAGAFAPAVRATVQAARRQSAAVRAALAAAAVTVYEGRGSLLMPNMVGVIRPDGTIEQFFSGAVILCTGARPALPAAPGLRQWAEAGPPGLWQRRMAPRAAAVLGGGPAALELAGFLSGCGTPVTLLLDPSPLPGAEPGLTGDLLEALAGRGVRLLESAAVRGLTEGPGESLCLEVSDGAGERLSVQVDCLLLAGPGLPRFDSSELAAVGVVTGSAGVQVDENLATTVPGIWAAGECTGAPRSHAAAQGVAAAAAACGISAGYDRRAIPECVFAEPELAWAGLSCAGAAAAGLTAHAADLPLARGGVLRLVVGDDDRLLGVHCLGTGAAALVTGVAPGLARGLTWQELAAAVAAHLAVPAAVPVPI